jgi:hypothetical protein
MHRFTVHWTSGLVLGAALGLTACSTAIPTGEEAGGFEVQTSAASLSGTFAMEDSVVTFSSTEVAANEFDVVVEVNGMTLTALVDRGGQVAEVDGFASGTPTGVERAKGADTQIVDPDRAALDAFVRALAGEVDTDEFAAAAVLYRVASNWSQTPDTMPLQRQVTGSENRDFVSICGNFGQFLEATHDDNNCTFFQPTCTSIAQVGNRASPTFSFINGQWVTTVPNHLPRVVQTGDCYGNCGASCPGNNPQTLTLDCLDHDQCVRNGHSIASFFCNDEFASASDDEFFAPSCSGT